MQRTATYQPGSATREARRAGLQHDETSRVEVIVGATPAQNVRSGDQLVPVAQAVHFCSSRIRVKQRHKAGDGQQIPECQVDILGTMPTLARPSIVRFEATAHSNGRLTFRNVSQMLAVPVPSSLIGTSPWAYDGGAEDVANAYGCGDDVGMMFEKYGEAVLA